MRYCSNCGSQLSEGASFCQNCGYKVDDQSTAQEQTNESTNANPQNQYVDNNQPNYNSEYPVVQNKDITKAVIFSIITIGIYSIIWFINIVNDVNEVCNDEKSSQSGGLVFFLTLVTFGIYGMVWFYQAGQRLYQAGKRDGKEINDNAVIYLILSLVRFSFINYILIQNDLNKYSEQLN